MPFPAWMHQFAAQRMQFESGNHRPVDQITDFSTGDYTYGTETGTMTVIGIVSESVMPLVDIVSYRWVEPPTGGVGSVSGYGLMRCAHVNGALELTGCWFWLPDGSGGLEWSA